MDKSEYCQLRGAKEARYGNVEGGEVMRNGKRNWRRMRSDSLAICQEQLIAREININCHSAGGCHFEC
jgi:hypothetical protein